MGKAIDRVSMWAAPGLEAGIPVAGCGEVQAWSHRALSLVLVRTLTLRFAVWFRTSVGLTEKQQQTLQMAILEHLYQQGMLSVPLRSCVR